MQREHDRVKSEGKSSYWTCSSTVLFLKFLLRLQESLLAQYSHLLKDTILVTKIQKIDEECCMGRWIVNCKAWCKCQRFIYLFKIYLAVLGLQAAWGFL